MNIGSESAISAKRIEKGRLQNVDALRGLAAFLVVFQHLASSAAGKYFPGTSAATGIDYITNQYCDLGRTGVVAFFAVSGFVIPFSFNSDRPIRKFMLSRFFRLYPAYWLSLAFACALAVSSITVAVTGKQALANVTMLQTWLHQKDVVGAYWTLALEELFYGLCIIVFVTGYLTSASYAIAGCTAFSLAALGMGIIHARFGTTVPMAIPLSLAVMHLGILARLAKLEGSDVAKKWLPTLAVATLAIIFVALWLGYPPVAGNNKSSRIAQCTSYLIAYGLFFVFMFKVKDRPSLLAMAGAISYSVYLFHQPILHMVMASIPAGNIGWLIVYLFTSLALTIAISMLVYYKIELPANKWGQRIARKHTTLQAVSV